MNHPSLYHKANEVQRHDAEQIIKEYAHKLHWSKDGTDALLDVGCGPGDVLMDFIYTLMPNKFEKVVGVDISPEMINYAQEIYRSNKKCDFKVLDIGTEQDLPSDLKGQFDHVTSLYCLHWVQNKRQAFRNIFNVIKDEGGDCFLVFLAVHPIFEAYKLLSKSSKWCSHLKGADNLMKGLYYSRDAKTEISNLLKEERFHNIQVDVRDNVFTYEDLQSVKDNFEAVNPFMNNIPPSLKKSFSEDLIHMLDVFNIKQKHPSKEADFIYKVPYKLVVVYAKKYPNYERD